MRQFNTFILLLLLLCSNLAFGAAFDSGDDEIVKNELNITAVILFLAFVLVTLGITYYSNKKNKFSRCILHCWGGGISGFQNGLAISGDYMSAAAFLGLTELIFSYGFDALVYPVGWTIAWPMILFLIAERFRNLGKFTFTDVIALR